MIYKHRLLESRLKDLTARFPVVIVSGARQVGKSTLVGHALPDWDTIEFDPVVDVGNARQDPDLFLDNHPPPLVLDEIQYAPELVAAVKRRVDRGQQPGQYVLTGSQQWAVLKSAGESLAGRAVFIDLEGFCLAEIAGARPENHWLQRYLDDPGHFATDRPERLPSPRPVYDQLWRGFLPGADTLEEEWLPEFHRAYLRTYIERDARLLADVGDWQQFGRFTRLAAALTAQEINHAQLGRAIGISPQTARRWLAILKATFQWFEAPVYHGNTVKRLSCKPKGYIADTGLACSLQMISTPKSLSGHPLAGALFETAVVAEIRKLAATMASPPGWYHWRSHGGSEVDVLLERDGRYYPIEIKLSSKPSRKDTRGISAFRQTYPHLKVTPGLVICPIERAMRLSERDLAMPWDAM